MSEERFISIFIDQRTTRLDYVLDFAFAEKGHPYRVFTAIDEWNALPNRDINYSYQTIDATVQITPQGLLFESDYYFGKKITFENNEVRIDGVVDLFSTIFYYLTRYEEYESKYLDRHGRIRSADNSLVKFRVHRYPYIDHLVKILIEKLEVPYSVKGFKIRPSFDIDIAWAYKNRSLRRTLGAAVKNGKIKERMQVLSGSRKDPYDTFDRIKEIRKKHSKTMCFILLGDWGKFDKNIKWTNKAFQALIRSLDEKMALGIHPSYASFRNVNRITLEKQRLEKITERPIKKSRQHFLRMKLPETYQELIQSGVEEDYSMGFADQVGFRAGTSFPFFFFDLHSNQKTPLRLFPFAYMDSAFKDYKKSSPEEAIQEIHYMQKEVLAVGGEFTFIWHNSSIHGKGEWEKWDEVLEETLKLNFE